MNTLASHGRVTLCRRIASKARWECQLAATELATQADVLKRWQKQCEYLLQEIESLAAEQRVQMARPAVDVEYCDHTSRMNAELSTALGEWEVAVEIQQDRLLLCRRELAATRQKQRKTEEKHQLAVRDQQLQVAAFEANELEGIYIGNYGRRR